ncbi:RNA polymerase sigma factor [Candidatus Nitronereus thalassa]|uniref:Sigma-70 family RNA polymerase sigma factor n=1 Tax=Candidatus Nitronereus thalassa TaxID=3020898 RepID=A0ABU3KB67_9BACT|nr:sigma-70 family RNA polymerase sigma factor [Candidatus Nitronereus thalassa]MDT7043592.1 sigma-70 family RNA polymerase sigma factor [Candidatus Nitronereus thalassa]
MMNSTQPSLTHSVSVAINELEYSLGELIPDSPALNSVQYQSVVLDAESPEQELLHALRNGDEAAFGSLVDRHHTRLLRLAKSYVPSDAVAEEVVQETWMGVLEGIHRFEGRSSLKTWIFQILTNRAKTRGKRESRYVSFTEATFPGDEDDDLGLEPERFHTSGALAGHWALPPSTWDEQTPERRLLSKEGMALMENAIHSLPANQRQVMILRDIEGLESEEICELLTISPSNQRVLLHRGRSKVRSALNDYMQTSSPGA